MKSLLHISAFAIIFSLGIISVQDAHAGVSTPTAFQNGDWNTGSTWVGGVVPGNSDDKIIPSGITVTVSTSVTNGGTITNSGTITISNTASIGLTNSGTITNSGGLITVSNTAVTGIYNSFGAINNNSGGHITISNTGVNSYGIYKNGGTITNSGTITISNTAGTGLTNFTGDINNNSGGLITISNTGVNSYGIVNTGGTIFNYSGGLITVSNTIGTGITNSGAINNNSGGHITISNTGVNSYGIVNNISRILTNAGTIQISNTAGIGIENFGIINNIVTINNQCGATYSGNPPIGNPINFVTCHFIATINGANEVPPSVTTATGFATFSYDNTINELTYDISFSGLSSAETGAHIHQGIVGVDGPIQFTLLSGSPKTGTVVLSASQETSLLAGELYVNIHSTNFSGGEIRGQIIPIDTCVPTNDWTVTSSCLLESDFTATGNVIVQNNSVLVIPNGVTLDIDFASKHLLVESGSKVLIKFGGKIF